MKQPIKTNQRFIVSTLLVMMSVLTGCKQENKEPVQPDAPQQKVTLEKEEPQKKVDASAIIRPVEGIFVKAETSVIHHRFNGTVKASKESRLSFRVSGNVTNLNAQIGQFVKKGQHIADLDATDYHINVNQVLANQSNLKANRQAILANIKQAEAEFIRARSAYLRAEKLYETDTISVSEFEQHRAAWQASAASLEASQLQYSSASAQLEASEQQVQTATNQLAYTSLKAPFSGVISQVLVEENEQIAAGQPVVLLSSIKDTEIEVGLPASVINTVKPGDLVSARFFNLSKQEFMGQVTKVGFSTGNSAVYPVVVKLKQTSPAIRPGMSADVLFVNQKSVSTNMMLPATAVGEDKNGHFVYKLMPVNTAKDAHSKTPQKIKKTKKHYIVKRQPVSLGKMSANGFIVERGVFVGELIAKAGLNVIQDGDEVVLFNEKMLMVPAQKSAPSDK